MPRMISKAVPFLLLILVFVNWAFSTPAKQKTPALTGGSKAKLQTTSSELHSFAKTSMADIESTLVILRLTGLTGQYWDPILSVDRSYNFPQLSKTMALPKLPPDKRKRHEKAVKNLRNLGVEVGDIENESGVGVLISPFSFDPYPELRAKALPKLADLGNIVYLHISSFDMSKGDSAVIAGLSELRVLSVTFGRCSDDDLTNLAKLKRLEMLHISAREASPDRVLELIDALPNLKALQLNASQIGLRSTHVRQLRKSHPQLKLYLR